MSTDISEQAEAALSIIAGVNPEPKKRGRPPKKTEDNSSNGVDISSQASSSNVVHVRLCHPGALVFPLAQRHSITLNGSNHGISTSNRRPLKIGEFGKTIINKTDWEAIVALFGHKHIFKTEMLVAFDSEEKADDWVAEVNGELRHGLDPADPDEDRGTERYTEG